MHDGDVPKDMLIYTQTSPDVTRVMREIDKLSQELTGGDDLEVWFDSGVSWPFQWYLRNYDNARFIGASLTQDPGNAPILLLGGNSGMSSQYLANYTATDYVLRWWFPEETYRGFAIAPEIPPGRSAWRSADQPHGPFDILRSIFDTVEGQENIDNQLRLYRLLMYRDLDWEIGQTPFQLYVRNDLLPALQLYSLFAVALPPRKVSRGRSNCRLHIRTGRWAIDRSDDRVLVEGERRSAGAVKLRIAYVPPWERATLELGSEPGVSGTRVPGWAGPGTGRGLCAPRTDHAARAGRVVFPLRHIR